MSLHWTLVAAGSHIYHPISGQGSYFMPSENTSVFRGYKMKALARNGLMTVLINYQGYYIPAKAYLSKSHFTSNICGLYLFKVNNKDNSKNKTHEGIC